MFKDLGYLLNPLGPGFLQDNTLRKYNLLSPLQRIAVASSFTVSKRVSVGCILAALVYCPPRRERRITVDIALYLEDFVQYQGC